MGVMWSVIEMWVMQVWIQCWATASLDPKKEFTDLSLIYVFYYYSLELELLTYVQKPVITHYLRDNKKYISIKFYNLIRAIF